MLQITRHALRKAEMLGIDKDRLAAAAEDPQVRYASSGPHAGQWRHIRDGVVAVISEDLHTVVTCYVNVVETALRDDQRDSHAMRYAARRRGCQAPAVR